MSRNAASTRKSSIARGGRVCEETNVATGRRPKCGRSSRLVSNIVLFWLHRPVISDRVTNNQLDIAVYFLTPSWRQKLSRKPPLQFSYWISSHSRTTVIH